MTFASLAGVGARVGMGIGVGLGVGVGEAMAVGAGVGVDSGDGVGVGVSVAVAPGPVQAVTSKAHTTYNKEREIRCPHRKSVADGLQRNIYLI